MRVARHLRTGLSILQCEARSNDVAYFLERPCGLMQRQIRLPRVREQSTTAALKDGVLTISMEKEKTVQNKVKIQVAEAD
jgi:HSP20 family molecular chaperone IbpA